jgi:hypothetical protein
MPNIAIGNSTSASASASASASSSTNHVINLFYSTGKDKII